jgi:tetratricopeptide (TPR) repeat protein
LLIHAGEKDNIRRVVIRHYRIDTNMKKSTEQRKHPRFMKRLAIKFSVNHKIFMGMSGNLSDCGIFIKTNRNFAVDSPIDIELLLPGKQTAILKGIIKRTSHAGLSSVNNGIGIQIIENDKAFMDFVKSIMQRGEATGGDEQAIQKTDTPYSLHNATGNKFNKITSTEKRQHRRFSSGQMRVKTDSASANKIVIINIGKGGMLVKSDKRLNVGHTYTMKLEYKDKAVFVNASVMWALLVKSIEDTYGNYIPLYLTGIQFRDAFEKIEDLVSSVESDAQAEIMSPVSNRKRNLFERAGSISQKTACHNISCEQKENSPEETTGKKQLAHRYFAKGKLEFWNGNYQKAEMLLQNALNLHNTCARYFAFYARTLLKLGKSDEAEKSIRQALKYDPGNSDYFVDAGDLYHTLGLSDKAEESYEMALSLQPSNIKAHKAIFRQKKMTEDVAFLNKNPLGVFRKMMDR